MVLKTLIDVLEKHGIPACEQGSLSGEYPERFFTFWNWDSVGEQYYDNDDNTVVWKFDVNFYTSNREEIESILNAAIDDLKSAGFIVSGRGYSIGSDSPDHTGRGVRVQFIEREV